MNYRHAFHAGNFADVVKHVALVAVIDALRRKDKPFSVIDTHAGAGRYALGAEASRTGEWLDGIGRIRAASDPPPTVARYLDLVRAEEAAHGPDLYPGSPALARALLREADRLTLVELHPDDAGLLRRGLGGDRRVAIHHRDGWEALRGLLPPQPRRGVVLVDPPFEKPGEFDRLARAAGTALRRWPEGAQILWYPIKDPAAVAAFARRAATAVAAAGPVREAVILELTLFATVFPSRLNGCGLLLVNPPFGTVPVLEAACRWLQPLLARDGGGVELRPLF